MSYLKEIVCFHLLYEDIRVQTDTFDRFCFSCLRGL